MGGLGCFPFARHLRSTPTSHIVHSRRGRIVHSGPGIAFYFRALNAAISEENDSLRKRYEDAARYDVYNGMRHLMGVEAEDLVGSRDYGTYAFEGGHIGIYVSGRAQTQVPEAIHGWLAER